MKLECGEHMFERETKDNCAPTNFMLFRDLVKLCEALWSIEELRRRIGALGAVRSYFKSSLSEIFESIQMAVNQV